MSVKIIAGPCSINKNNVKEMYEIASINKPNHKVIEGLRVVGLKLRTELKHSAEYMGIDFDVDLKLCYDLINGVYSLAPNTTYLSAEIAKDVIAKQGELKIASEIVDPFSQIPIYAQNLCNKFFGTQ